MSVINLGTCSQSAMVAAEAIGCPCRTYILIFLERSRETSMLMPSVGDLSLLIAAAADYNQILGIDRSRSVNEH